MKQDLICLPLEKYQARYTQFLQQWEKTAFEEKFNVKFFEGHTPQVLPINSGRVLDSINRPLTALAQVSELLMNHQAYSLGKLYFSDFFHPGLEALAYSGIKFTASCFLWAQSFDWFDFTSEPDMLRWMRPWEVMAFEIYSRIFVAHPLLKELICSALPHVSDKIIVVGLPFNSKQVLSQLDTKNIPAESYSVVYTSRWDNEKNPQMFVDLVKNNPDLKCVVCTGRESLTGSAIKAIEEAHVLEEAGKLKIYRGCSKALYYGVLTRSRIQLNTSFQDWISYTLLEALTFGCLPMYPNHRSFPSTLNYDQEVLYIPLNQHSMESKIRSMLEKNPSSYKYRDQILASNDSALSVIAQEMESL